MAAYYNEIDLYAAEWLRNLIKAGHIADGEVDTRSIVDVQPDDIRHFDQCHFFAGIAGWSHALRLAGWSDDRKIWTGSCPCQPFSVAGQGKGTDDPRHLWPHFFRLIRGCRPQVVMGEQVAGAAGYGWLDGVRFDLESEDYAIEGVDIAACSVNAPHIRQRLYWVAVDNANSSMRQTWRGNGLGTEEGWSSKRSASHSSDECNLDNAQGERLEGRINNTAITATESGRGNAWATGCDPHDMADTDKSRPLEPINDAISSKGMGTSQFEGNRGFWHDAIWLNGADGKTRRVGTDFRCMANGFSDRMAGCGSRYADEAFKEIENHAKAFSQSRAKSLREVWEFIWEEPETFWGLGKYTRVQSAQILFPFMCKLSSSCGETGESLSCEEIQGFKMRSMWDGKESAFASCERQSSGKHSREYSNSLQELSRILAQYAGEAWEEYRGKNATPLRLLEVGEKNRAGKLRALGNAIVPPLAAEVIKAFMES